MQLLDVKDSVILMSSSATSISNKPTVTRDDLYRLLARNLPDKTVFLLNDELQILIAEGDGLSNTPYSPANLEGRLVTEVLTALDSVALIQQYRTALKEGRDSVQQYHWDQSDYQIHAIPVMLNENTTYLMVVADNITRRLQAQQTLERAESRTRALLEALPDTMFVTDRQGTITQVQAESEASPLFSQVSVGQTLAAANIDPIVSRKAMSALQDTFETGKAQSYEYEAHLDSEDHYYEARTVAVNDTEAITLVRDITLYRRTARSLTERNHDLEILRAFDQDLTQVLSVDYVMERAAEYLVPVTEATCMAICLTQNGTLQATYCHGVDESAVQQMIAGAMPRLMELMENRHPLLIDLLVEDNWPLLLPDNRSVLLLPIIAADNALGLLVLEKQGTFTARHISSVEHMLNRLATGLENARLYEVVEDQLNEVQELYAKVQRLEQIKTDMIRIASHDLKNPLTGMRGYLEMLSWDAAEVLNDQQKGYLKEITNAAERMQQMIYGILSLDRIQQMADNTLNERVNLKMLVERVLHDHENTARQHMITFRSQIIPSSVIVMGDPFQLQEAITNLIGNAIKYTPDRGYVTTSLSCRGGEAVFQVEDTGYGIPQAMHDRLFTPFFRARSRETQAVEGSGLGLHLVKNIISRHEGRLIFDSKPGKGSTFGFALPLKATNGSS